ncbi:hypothetical protein [Parafrankia sp. FMc2]|uniref:hypothetical protein n=1 Tax=Parafrankia sp. FMc2 TaxID=3233196 RepID=UPI0034D66C85
MNTSGAGSPLPRPVTYLARNRLSRGERQRTGGTFSADMAALGLEPRVEVEVGPDEADATLALDLGLDEGTQVLVRRRRRMYGGGFPMRLATSFPCRPCPRHRHRAA